MKREKVVIVFAALLMVFVLSLWAHAQEKAPVQVPVKPSDKDQAWKIYLESEDKKYYFSPASVQRLDKRRVRVWEKVTDKTKDGETDRVKSLFEFDCSSSKYRIVAEKVFDPATGADKPDIVSENEPWTYFNLESILGVLYDNVCYQGGLKVPTTSKPVKEKKK